LLILILKDLWKEVKDRLSDTFFSKATGVAMETEHG